MTENTPAKHQAIGYNIEVFMLEDLCNDAWHECAPTNTQSDTGKLLNESLRQKYFETVRNRLESYVGPLGYAHEPGKPVPENPRRFYEALLDRNTTVLFVEGMERQNNIDKCPYHATFAHVTAKTLMPRLKSLESNQWICLFSSQKKETSND